MSTEGELGSLNDWTFIQSSEGVENEERPHGYSSADTVELSNVQLEAKIQEVEDGDSHQHTDGSDVERISEDGTEEICTNSIISRTSHFSFIQANDGMEADIESISCGSSSGISVVAEEDNCDFTNFSTSKDNERLITDLSVPAPRSYTHTPNRKLNIALSIVLILSFTLVFGLGIGHFLGWSSRWSRQNSLHQSHIVKLLALQQELSTCLKSHADDGVTATELAFCYEKIDYWKTKFEDILSKNRVLQDFISKNKADVDYVVENDEKSEEGNKNMMAEYQKLKFHLISQQLENVETLRKIEEMKKQEMEILDGMKQLEDENKKLKAYIELDEAEESSQSENDKADELLINKLSEENVELKKELTQLTVALEMEEADDTKANEEIGSLRQRINSLLTENADLQKVIARLRYAESVQNVVHNDEQGAETAPEDTWLESTGIPDLNIAGFIDNLLKIATDKEAAKKELSQLQENLKNSYNELSKKAKEGIHTGQHILEEMHREFESKVAALLNGSIDSASLSTETIRQMGSTLGNAMLKLYKIGVEGMEAINDEGTGKNDESGVAKKIGKVLSSMEKQWENIRDKMWGTSKKKNSVISGDKKTELNESETRPTEKNLDIPVTLENDTPDDVAHLNTDPANSKNINNHTDKQETKPERNSEEMNVETFSFEGNCTAETDNGFQERTDYRDSAGVFDYTQSNNWVFDRASSREKSRLSEMDLSNWYLQRGKQRRTVITSTSSPSFKKQKKLKKDNDDDDDDDDDDDNKKRIKKKAHKKTKSKKTKQNKKREYKYDSDDDDHSKKHNNKKFHSHKHYRQNFEWQIPDSYMPF